MKKLVLLFLFCISPNTFAADDPSVKDCHRLTTLPHIYINTFTGQSIVSKTSYVYARMWYVDEDDHVMFYDSLQIRGRGNSTWDMAKKPYRIKFQQKEKLLGKGYAKTKKWTLLANHADKTLIRNAITSLMGERAGLTFNPAAKFVDLTLNDSYVGTYQLSDHIDVRPHRVNIQEQDYPLADTSDLSGGYLLEADGFKDFHPSSYWNYDLQAYAAPDGFYTSKSSVPVRIHYPDAEDLDVSQTDYIRSFIADFETRLFSSDFAHATDGYRPLVDSLSLVNWYLCTEMSGNIDGFFSTYFYKEQQDDHLFWGPLWDYDIAYNNDNRTNRGNSGTSNTEQQLMSEVGYGNVKLWIRQMWKDPWFAILVNRRYGQLIGDGMELALNEHIDSLTTLLESSVQLNYERWGISTRNLRERVLYSTYDEYVNDLRTYINHHFAYLQKAFAAFLPEAPEPEPDPELPEVDFDADPMSYYAISNVGSSTCFDVRSDNYELCANGLDDTLESQQWQIRLLQNGYHFITNRATGYALNDPTTGEPTATTLVGTHLTVAPADTLDTRQQWQLVAQGDERYNIINRFTQHGANLSGGNQANGTPVISYTNDNRNSISKNRMWMFTVVDEVTPEEPDAIGQSTADVDYALAYDPYTGRLHFGSDALDELRFTVSVYDSVGRLVISFRATDGTSLAALPHGLYLVTWSVNGRRRTVRLMK